MGEDGGKRMANGWAIALVEPNRDFEVDLRLRRSGYRVVFLTYRKQLTNHHNAGWRKATDCIGVPLLAGYLFLDLHENQTSPDPERIAGYCGLLRDGQVRIADEVVSAWQTRVWSGEFDDMRETAARPVGPSKFQPANSPDERRKLFETHFSHLLANNELDKSA